MNRFSKLRDIYEQSELIFSDGYLSHASVCESCDYQRSDMVLKSGIWRDSPMPSLLKRERREGHETLILGHSDHLINSFDYYAAKLKGYKSVSGINFGVNQDTNRRALPLGLTNDTLESYAHELFGDHSLLLMADMESSTPKDFQPRFYANFSSQNNAKVRNHILNLVKNLDVEISIPDFTKNGRIDYLKKLRETNFVLCPEGNGVDTHRLWETLYMGGTPIVKSHIAIDNLVSTLPVILVKNWEQILDNDFLEESWYRLEGKIFDFNKLRLSYWVNSFCKTQI